MSSMRTSARTFHQRGVPIQAKCSRCPIISLPCRSTNYRYSRRNTIACPYDHNWKKLENFGGWYVGSAPSMSLAVHDYHFRFPLRTRRLFPSLMYRRHPAQSFLDSPKESPYPKHPDSNHQERPREARPVHWHAHVAGDPRLVILARPWNPFDRVRPFYSNELEQRQFRTDQEVPASRMHRESLSRGGRE